MNGARIQLRVVPGSRRAGIAGRHGEGWKIRVTASPERGRANDEVVRLLSDVLGIKRGEIQVVSGHTSRDKVVEISGLTPAAAEARLEAASA